MEKVIIKPIKIPLNFIGDQLDFCSDPGRNFFRICQNVLYIIKTTFEKCPEMMPAVHMFQWKVLFWKSIRYQI
jgi:hypothetical protein